MKSAFPLVWVLLLAAVQGSWQLPDSEDHISRLTEVSETSPPRETPHSKRHSEGTFSNDYSKYLESRRVQDFVQWLKNSKRNGDQVQRRAERPYTSDPVWHHVQGPYTSDPLRHHAEGPNTRDPVRHHAQGTYTSDPVRRHAEGTYTSDVSSYLQDQAAKEFVSWLKTGRGRRD